jgi:High-affinity nickel-transport protein
MSPASTLLLGLLLGLRHATDPDHVVAMATIVTRDPHLRRAISTGVFWGIGHTATVLLVGALMLVGNVRVPERVFGLLDLTVAVMLVALGFLALRTRRAFPTHRAPGLGERILVSRLRPLLVGIVHGLAGSAAMTLIALATIQDERGALLYLGLFGAGTVLGMVGITALLALSFRWASTKSARLPIWIARMSGTLSIAAGVLLARRVLLPQ